MTVLIAMIWLVCVWILPPDSRKHRTTNQSHAGLTDILLSMDPPDLAPEVLVVDIDKYGPWAIRHPGHQISEGIGELLKSLPAAS